MTLSDRFTGERGRRLCVVRNPQPEDLLGLADSPKLELSEGFQASVAACRGLGESRGKEEMAGAVLGEIEAWFTTHIFAPLQWDLDAASAIDRMFRAVVEYFDSGRRVCLVGAFALATSRDRFAKQVRSYFRMWKEALAAALVRIGRDKSAAEQLAEEALAVIQGSLVLARALDDRTVFARSMTKLRGVLLKVEK